MGRTMNEQSNDQVQLLNKIHRWRLAFFGIVILIAGIVIGAAVAMIYKAAVPPQHPDGIEFVDAHSLQRLRRELNLSDKQSNQIEKIFNGHLKTLNDIRSKARPKIAEEMNSLYTDVVEILDEQQREKWKKSIHRLREDLSGQPKGFRRGMGRQGKNRPDGHEGPGWQQRPFNMWDQEQNDEGSMRRRKGPGMGPGSGMRQGPGMGPGPDGFGPPPEDDLSEEEN